MNLIVMRIFGMICIVQFIVVSFSLERATSFFLDTLLLIENEVVIIQNFVPPLIN